VTVRPVAFGETARFNAELDTHHWLGHRLTGQVLRYVAELDGRWVAVLGFGSPTRIQQIFNRGGDYILTVKGNMPSLERRCSPSAPRTGLSPLTASPLTAATAGSRSAPSGPPPASPAWTSPASTRHSASTGRSTT